MPRTFENYTCSTFRTSDVEINGQMKPQDVAVYTAIPCAFWKASSGGRVDDTNKAVDTNLNKYEVNLDSIYTDIEIHDKMHIDGKDYEVIDKILHHNRLGALDNIQIFISILDDA